MTRQRNNLGVELLVIAICCVVGFFTATLFTEGKTPAKVESKAVESTDEVQEIEIIEDDTVESVEIIEDDFESSTAEEMIEQ